MPAMARSELVERQANAELEQGSKRCVDLAGIAEQDGFVEL